MDTPIQIIFRDVPSSPAVEEAIRKEAAEIQNYCRQIVSARAVVSEPHRRQRQGRRYCVQITVVVPGQEIVVSHGHGQHPGHEDVYLAVRVAFHAVRRELEDYVRRARHQVKTHPAQTKKARRKAGMSVVGR